jgi:hypothetical protein
MKIAIEISGGVICNIVSTEDVKIYLVDHDIIKTCDPTADALSNARSPFHPDRITGENDSDDNDTTPEFDQELEALLAGYEPEEVA